MAEFFDFNHDRGCWYEADFRDDGSFTIHTRQNIQPILDAIKKKRDHGNVDAGIKNDWWHYCSIPVQVELELRGKGIDIYNPAQTTEVLREINQNYPALKLTRLHHE